MTPRWTCFGAMVLMAGLTLIVTALTIDGPVPGLSPAALNHWQQRAVG